MTTEPQPANAPDASDHRAGVLWSLGLGFVAAVIACVLVLFLARAGVELAQEAGAEIPVLARFYVGAAPVGFAAPVVLLLLGLALTRLGRGQHRVGVMLALALFAFALFWSGCAMLAFRPVYDPPRHERHPSGS